MKNGFFQINQLGIGLLVRKCAEIGQKWEFIALFSEIYMKIEHFLIFELNYTSAPIAQLAERLTFFIWFWLDQTSPERVRVQFPLEERDFFSLFKLIFLSIFCMHLYHILINWSQKFWVVYVCYRFILEQCDLVNLTGWKTELLIAQLRAGIWRKVFRLKTCPQGVLQAQ